MLFKILINKMDMHNSKRIVNGTGQDILFPMRGEEHFAGVCTQNLNI